MPEPSDLYTYRDFILDLERRFGCTRELIRNPAGIPLPYIARQCPDGRRRTALLVAPRLEAVILPRTRDTILRRLDIDPEEFESE